MKNLNRDIKITTGEFKHEFACYYKCGVYDIYLNGQCIKTNATREDIQLLNKVLNK